MKTIGVIPARWRSSRFPGKPLVPLLGKPMIQHVWERCSASGVFHRLIVATDSPKIASVVKRFGGTAMQTSRACKCGTDRVAEVARRTRGDVYFNVQGDGPLVDPKELRDCAAVMSNCGPREIVTTAAPITSRRQWLNPSVVKLVCGKNGEALYFSRAPIPHQRDGEWPSKQALAHLSVYGFRRNDLLLFSRAKPTTLENTEQLEMLRALEMGWKIRIVMASAMHPEVDTPADVKVVERVMRRKGSF